MKSSETKAFLFGNLLIIYLNFYRHMPILITYFLFVSICTLYLSSNKLISSIMKLVGIELSIALLTIFKAVVMILLSDIVVL